MSVFGFLSPRSWKFSDRSWSKCLLIETARDIQLYISRNPDASNSELEVQPGMVLIVRPTLQVYLSALVICACAQSCPTLDDALHGGPRAVPVASNCPRTASNTRVCLNDVPTLGRSEEQSDTVAQLVNTTSITRLIRCVGSHYASSHVGRACLQGQACVAKHKQASRRW